MWYIPLSLTDGKNIYKTMPCCLECQLRMVLVDPRGVILVPKAREIFSCLAKV